MRDYYKILGVKETASEEEIRECWVRWMRKLHPDHVGAQRADERRVREINEAYEILKFPDSRARYDLGRVYQRKKKSVAFRKAFLRKSYLLALPVVLALVYLSVHEVRPPSVPKSAEEPPVSSAKPAVSEPPEEENHRFKTWQSLQRPSLFVGTGEARSQGAENKSSRTRTDETHRRTMEETPVQVATKNPTQSAREPEEKRSPSSQESPQTAKDHPKELGAGVTRQPMNGKKDSTVLLREVNRVSTGHQGAGNVPRSADKPFAGVDEVEKFIEDYLKCYTQRDIRGFLGFFSSGAVQNGKENIDEIKRIYTRFFDQSESLLYHLKHPTIQVLSGNARVKASYEIKQTLRAGGTRFWKGNIEWALIRENGELKISSIQYAHDRSP